MKFKSILFKAIIPVSIALSLILLISCEQSSPVAPQESSGQVTILKIAATNPDGLHKIFKAHQEIDEDGGTIVWGDEECGYTYLEFPEDALDDDAHIYGYWRSENLLQADFYPEGLQFNKPVYVRMSYKDVDLGSSQPNLGMYYYNESTANWELISTSVNTAEKYIEGYITHFSRYAIGME